MLLVLPLAMLGIWFGNYYGPGNFPVFTEREGVIPWDWWRECMPAARLGIGMGLILAEAYLLVLINAKYKFLPQRSTLPALLYVLLILPLVLEEGAGMLLFVVLPLTLALGGLEEAINDTKSNGPIFNFGFFISFSVLLYPKAVLFALWAFCVLFFSGRSTLKDVVALFIGLLTPCLFVTFYYFWTDSLAELPKRFVNHLAEGEYLHSLQRPEWIQTGLLIFLFLLALSHLAGYYSASIVNQRRGVFALLSMLFFAVVTILFIPGIQREMVYLLAIPLSYVYSQYFITQKRRFIGDAAFLLFITACCIGYF